MKLLVTGFPKFDAFPQNSTQTLIESVRNDLPRELADLEGSIAWEVLEIDNTDSVSQQKTMLTSIHRLLERHAPTACLFCGQAASCPQVTVEAIAINAFKGEIIDSDGPPAYWATLPNPKALVQTLQSEEIPARLSYHAGTHMCNDILYTALRHAATRRSGMLCGFLHLPMTAAQVISADEDRPFLALTMMRRALILTIQHVHRHATG